MKNFVQKFTSLDSKKKQLLLLKLREQNINPKNIGVFAYPRNQKYYPLSWAQHRFWLIDQLNPGDITYNIPMGIRIKGVINVSILEKSLNEIIGRHEVLRSSFYSQDGDPVQIIGENRELKLGIYDLSSLMNDETEVNKIIKDEVTRPFDLSKGPLLRANLYKINQEEYFLILTIHHIISDGWSMDILYRETTSIYESLLSGQHIPNNTSHLQYLDYTLWQRDFEEETHNKQISYWKEKLEGSPNSINLRTDEVRPSIQSYNGKTEMFKVSSMVSQNIKTLSMKYGTSIFMTFLSAFKVLLHKYTGEEDLIVGTPIANRSYQEVEGVFGCFANTLALRTIFSSNYSFIELLECVKETAINAYANQEVPFERIVEELKPNRDPSYSPLFQVMFMVSEHINNTVKLNNLEFSPLDIDNESAKYDLTLSIEETNEGFIGRLNYNSDLFNNNTIKRMFGHFNTLLSNIIKNPHQKISELEYLTQQEYEDLLNVVKPISKENDKSIQSLFEEQVIRTPNKTALVFEGQELTYSELDRRADQLANYLQKRGIGPNEFVGICMDRSIDLIVGILGVLKAGGAYVPIDPRYPEERIAFMLEDSGINLCITQSQYEEKLSSKIKLDLIFPSEVINLQACDSECFEYKVVDNPSNLAYMIYTSGSTGQPKGVLVSHSNVTRLFSATDDWFKFNEEDVWTLFHSCSFDFSVWEIWGPLLKGGKLVIVPYWTTKDPEAFCNLLEKEKVTVLNQTPSAFKQIMNVEGIRSDTYKLSLRFVIFGGEALDFRSLKHWIEKYGDKRPEMINMYGITETTVHVTYQPVKEEEIDTSKGSVIGVPIPDLEVYVMDKNKKLVPIGVPGELYVGGAGVTKGYHNRPELTKERFIKSPFSEKNDALLYKTGDMARCLSDGRLEYLGRSDNQVKIRGFRVELGEIQETINRHPKVKEVVISTLEDHLGNPQLIAYIALKNNTEDIKEIRNYIELNLPDHMIPSKWVLIRDIPLTEHGKVDFSRLPNPENEYVEEVDGSAPPASLVERLISDIYCFVLQRSRIGVHDNFFAIGGHSILATQVISRINKTFKINLSLRTIFEEPTIYKLSKKVELSKKNNKHLIDSVITKAPKLDYYPLSYAQQRLYFLGKLWPGNTLYNVPITFKLDGELNKAILEEALNELLKRHWSLRTGFTEYQGKPKQFINPYRKRKLIVKDLSNLTKELQEKEINEFIQMNCEKPFDLQQCTFDFYLICCSKDEHLLVTNSHHIITDGLSQEILINDLAIIYEALENKTIPLLKPINLQYIDYAYWQKESVNEEILNKQLGYWKSKLSGEIPVIQLPLDKIIEDVNTGLGGSIRHVINANLTRSLRKLSDKSGTTLFVTLLAAIKVLIARLSGQKDILVGTPVANRNNQELEPLIGLFLNTLVLRTDLSGQPTFYELIQRIQSTTLEAINNQDIPFEKLVEEIKPERNMFSNPFFDIMINFHNGSNFRNEFSDIKIGIQNIQNIKSKFLISLDVTEQSDSIIVESVYKPSLFSKERMKHFLDQLELILTQVVEDEYMSIDSYTLITEGKIRTLPNPTQELIEPKRPFISEMVDEWVQKKPNKVAVTKQGKSWTYKEFAEASISVCNKLIDLGLEKGEVVTIIGDRSFAYYTAMLGVLRSGGVLLSIDKQNVPIERQKFMMNKASSKYLIYIGDAQLKEQWFHAFSKSLHIKPDEVFSFKRERTLPEISSDDPAYISFTSGSTGTPKGILGRHKGLNNCIDWMRKEFKELGTEDRFSQTINLSFDYAFRDVFLPLSLGATVCIPDDIYDFGPDKFLSWIQRENVNVIQTVPSLARLWVSSSGRIGQNLKYTFFAGEPVSDNLVKKWRNVFGGEIVNAYGPTETTMVMCFNKIPEDVILGTQSVGWPLPNTQVLIVNPTGELCGVGEVGSVIIRSPFRTLGYIDLPEENKKRFRLNPFNMMNKKDVVYLTGDIGRYGLNGEINILGRQDDQVKVRGVRVDLNEISTILSKHTSIDLCTINDYEDKSGNINLAAYILPNKYVSESEVRDYLSSKLPTTMVPSIFIFLEKMPLTPYGKIDKKKLPLPVDYLKKQKSLKYVAPRNSLELKLVNIWSEVLNKDKVGIKDNFFEIGGHSLKAMEIVSKIRSYLDCEIPLRVFIKSPTIENLANTIHSNSFKEQNTCLVELQKGTSKKTPLFLIHPSGGGVLCYMPLVKELGPEYSVYGIQSVGYETEEEPLTCVEEMADRYIKEIRKVRPKGPYRLAAWSFGVVILYEIIRRFEQNGEELDFIGFIDYLPLLQNGEKISSKANIDKQKSLNMLDGNFIEDMEFSESNEKSLKVHEGNNIANNSFRFKGAINSDFKLFCASEKNTTKNFPLINSKDAQKITLGEVQIFPIPGNHYTLCSAPHVTELASQIKSFL